MGALRLLAFLAAVLGLLLGFLSIILLYGPTWLGPLAVSPFVFAGTLTIGNRLVRAGGDH